MLWRRFMDIRLNDVEARVLGSLVEKELATPEHYPLSLNALINACNQKSNREPVVSYSEATVREAVDGLIEMGLVNKTDVGRVPKYEQGFTQPLNLIDRESAVICVMLLRGPQTPGALRTRTARLCQFDHLDHVMETLANLEEWGFACRLPRLPGHKESRYTHLLSGEVVADASSGFSTRPMADDSGRIDRLEQDLAAVRRELDHLTAAFEAFRSRFD
jgi:hypothetical protein